MIGQWLQYNDVRGPARIAQATPVIGAGNKDGDAYHGVLRGRRFVDRITPGQARGG